MSWSRLQVCAAVNADESMGIEDVGAQHMAERLRTRVDRATWPGGPVSVRIRAGSAMPDSGTSPHERPSRSERALFAAQRNGRNRSRLFVGPYS